MGRFSTGVFSMRQAQRGAKDQASKNEAIQRSQSRLVGILDILGPRHIRCQMLPQTIVAPLGFVVEALAALALDQTLATAAIGNNNHSQLGIDFPFAIPIAAGGTNFYFGGNDYFFLIHDELAAGFVGGQSVYLSIGSFKENIPSLAIISV